MSNYDPRCEHNLKWSSYRWFYCPECNLSEASILKLQVAELKSQLAKRDEPCVCGHTESLTGMGVLYVLDYCTKCGHKIEVKSDEKNTTD